MMIELTSATVRTMPLAFAAEMSAIRPDTAVHEDAPGTGFFAKLESALVAVTLALQLALGIALIAFAR